MINHMIIIQTICKMIFEFVGGTHCAYEHQLNVWGGNVHEIRFNTHGTDIDIIENVPATEYPFRGTKNIRRNIF